MKVILYTSVDGLGNRGDIVDVADGFARNSLIPRQMAAKATKGAEREAQKMKAAWEQKNAQERGVAEELAQRLASVEVQVPARVGSEGKLFGSVGTKDIAAQLSLVAGNDFDRKMIQLDEPIKAVGSYVVPVRPHSDVTFDVNVVVHEA